MPPATEKFTAGSEARAPGEGSREEWGEIVLVPVKLTASIPFKNLRLRELCELQAGTVLATAHAAGLPVPVSVAGTFIGWAEFQVVGERLALRLADLE